MSLVQCTKCLEVVEESEPCWCVFTSDGLLNDAGQLHTAPRIAVDRNVLEMQLLAEEAHRQLAYAAQRQAMYDEVDEHAYECLPMSKRC